MMIPAGGETSARRDNLLMNDAIMAAGNRLWGELRSSMVGMFWLDLRRCEEGIQESEESGTVLDVHDVSVEQGV